MLFVGAVAVAVGAAVFALPALDSATRAAVFITLVIAADLAIVFGVVHWLLGRAVFEPLGRIGAHAEQIAGGAYEHRIPTEEGEELDRLVRSLNTMAERLISDQKKLVENVRSLDRTNRDLVETTEELVRAARMVAVGTLAAGLAHEVGNPLGALIGYLDVARRRASGRGDLEPPLESAVEEARRIDRIVRSVLEFASPERGRGPNGEVARKGAVSVPHAVDRALALLEGRGALAGVEVRNEIEPGSHLVTGLPQHLEQILLNLLMNAILAVRGRPGPELIVRVSSGPAVRDRFIPRRMDDPPEINYSHRRRLPALLAEGEAVHEAPLGTEVILDVLDNGPGIPPDRISRLFDPFYTTRAPGEGTGLGLSITARIVEELGGRILVANREEGGARFTVRLPEVTQEPAAVPAEPT
jgi:C4-dicarboxylate-specific signal transduction histidine kinase